MGRPTGMRTVVALGAAVPITGALAAAAPAETTSDGNATDGLSVTYRITELDGDDGAGLSVNNRNWVSGTTPHPDDGSTRATLWRDGEPQRLGTLGGKHSAILWPNKNVTGVLAGIAETDDVDSRDEAWSCAAFFGEDTENACVGFVWEDGDMRELPTHGGTHGFAAGVNNRGQVVGWAETQHEDETCDAEANQELGFLGAIWDTRNDDEVRTLLPLAGTGDTATAANAINDWGQAVGISGVCDQAVGRLSARTAVLWQPGQSRPIEIGHLGSPGWNTPMAINNLGMVVGFANAENAEPTTFDEVPFRWTTHDGIEQLELLDGDTNGQALGVNVWGRVAGLSRTGGDSSAVIWKDGEAVDLNALAPEYDGHLRYANDINDWGVITGQAGNADGERVAYRATPEWAFGPSAS